MTEMGLQMFKKTTKKEKPGATVIGLSAMVIGNIVSENFVLLDGGIEGDIIAPEALINGLVMGNICAAKEVEIAEKAKIQGDVVYKSVLVQQGAKIFGKLINKENVFA